MPATNYGRFQFSSSHRPKAPAVPWLVAVWCLAFLIHPSLGQDAANPFESPLAPLPPQLLNADREGFVKGLTQQPEAPELEPLRNSAANTEQLAIQSELVDLHRLVDALRGVDTHHAGEITAAVRRVIREQTEIAQDLVDRLPNRKFSSKYAFSKPRFGVAKKYIESLRQLGQEAATVPYTKQLKLMELLHAGDGPMVPSEHVELHHVAIEQGSALPPQYATGIDRYTTGFAEVHLNHSAAPVVLLLTAKESIVWKVKTSADTRILAVVIDSDREQIVSGIEGTTILRQNDFVKLPVSFLDATEFPNVETLYSAAMTRFEETSYSGQPIVIGMGNKDWANAYLVSRAEELLDDCVALHRVAQAEQLQGLSFKAIFAPSIGRGQSERAYGDFNIAGPISSSLIPVKHADLDQTIDVRSAGRLSREFGLTRDGRFVFVSGNELKTKPTATESGDKEPESQTEFTPVPLPESLAGRSSFDEITYDSSRDRLVLASTAPGNKADLVAFDIENGSWTEIGSFVAQRFLGLEYVAHDDEIWAAVVNAEGHPELLQVQNDGDVNRQRIAGSLEANMLPMDLSSSQLVEVSGMAAILATRSPRLLATHSQHFAPELFIIDPASGEVIYRNQMKINDGKRPLSVLSKRREKPGAVGAHVLLNLVEQLRQAEQELLRLKAKKSLHAESLAQQLESTNAMLYGQECQGLGPKVHVVARYTSSHPVEVKVTDASGPVTLVLCGNHRMDWRVEKAPNVQLSRIILSGPLPQKLISGPDDAVVEKHFGRQGVVVHDPRNRRQLKRAQERILDLVSADVVSSFAVAHHAHGQQIVGPENASWRLQVALSTLGQLKKTTDASSAPSDFCLEKLRFYAVHHGSLPRGSSDMRFPLDPFVSSDDVYWNQFSVRGPLIGESIPVHRSVRCGVLSDDGRWIFTGTMAAVTIRDEQQRTSAQLDLTANKPSIGHLAGIGYDEKRDRLLISASRGLFAYTLQDQRVERLRDLDGLTRSAFTYSSDREMAFAIRAATNGRGEIHSIERFNPFGVRLPSLRLSHPITLGSPYNYSYSNLQLVSIDDYLVVLRYHHQRNQRLLGGNRIRTSPKGRLWVIHLRDDISQPGELVYETSIQPSLVYRDISRDELASKWEQLADRYPENLESDLWSFAAGGHSAVDFLKSKYKAEADPLSHDEIQELVKQLGDARFSARDRAFKQLQAASSRIAPTLASCLSRSQSTEVSERLQQILSKWEVGMPQTDDDFRLVRGLEVLHRIGASDADDLLLTLTAEHYPSLVRRHAARILDEHTRPVGDAEFENPVLRLQRNLFVPR